jgi:hypothetical protein
VVETASGRGEGADRLGELYARNHKLPLVVAFRSPRSKGTNDTVKKATKHGFKVFMIDYDTDQLKADDSTGDYENSSNDI